MQSFFMYEMKIYEYSLEIYPIRMIYDGTRQYAIIISTWVLIKKWFNCECLRYHGGKWLVSTSTTCIHIMLKFGIQYQYGGVYFSCLRSFSLLLDQFLDCTCMRGLRTVDNRENCVHRIYYFNNFGFFEQFFVLDHFQFQTQLNPTRLDHITIIINSI